MDEEIHLISVTEMATLAAIGIVTKDMKESVRFYRLLGVEVPDPSGDHLDVTLPSGVALMWDTLELIKRTPWHYHPGPTFVTVQQGQITFQESDCSTRTYTAGQSFVEGGSDNIGRAQNTGTTPATVYVLFVTPVGSPMTFPVTGPACP